MRGSVDQLTPAALEFLRERHLATLTTLLPDGRPHVVPVGFTWDPDAGLARVITNGPSRKARNAALGGPVALCQFEGRRWLTIEGRPRSVPIQPGSPTRCAVTRRATGNRA